MDVGSLVQYADQRWVVFRRDETSRTVQLRAWEGRTQTCAEDDEALNLICHPPTDWPYLPAPIKPKAGPIASLHITRGPTKFELEGLIDWVPSDFLRPGAPIFINPAVNLRVGEVLVAVHTKGGLTRLDVGKSFATVAQRIQRAMVPKKVPVSAYDRLLRDEEDIG